MPSSTSAIASAQGLPASRTIHAASSYFRCVVISLALRRTAMRSAQGTSAPGLVGPAGGGDRLLGVLRGRLRDLADDLLRPRRVDRVPQRRRHDILAVDHQAVGLAQFGPNLGQGVRHRLSLFFFHPIHLGYVDKTVCSGPANPRAGPPGRPAGRPRPVPSAASGAGTSRCWCFPEAAAPGSPYRESSCRTGSTRGSDSLRSRPPPRSYRPCRRASGIRSR